MVWISKASHTLEKVVDPISRLFNFIAIGVLMVMVFFVATDVFRRYVFNSPMESSYEVVEFMMAFVFIFGVAYTQRQKGHVAVTLVVSRLRKRAQAIINSAVYFICFGFLCLLTWQAFVKARVIWVSHGVSCGAMGIFGHVPVAPFFYAVASACVPLCMVLLVDFITSLAAATRK